MKSQAAIVTGGAGFIGSHLVRRLLGESDCPVVNLDKLTYAGNLDSLKDVESRENYQFCELDIGDRAGVGKLLKATEPTTIFNLAAESHVDRSIDGPLPFVTTNVVGTVCLLEEVLAYWQGLSAQDQERFRFVHISTDEVFGELGDTGKFTEASSYSPNSPYSASKASSDHFVRAYHATFGLPIIITNCSNNYGPFQFPEKLIPLMILNAIEGRPLPIYGDGKNVRDWLFVDDHCRALQRIASEGRIGETYLIGGDCERTNVEVVQAICDIVEETVTGLGVRPHELISFVKDRPGHDQRYAIAADKLKTELGWSPSVRFEEGLRETVAWYVANDWWVRRVTSGAYRGERLGLKGET